MSKAQVRKGVFNVKGEESNKADGVADPIGVFVEIPTQDRVEFLFADFKPNVRLGAIANGALKKLESKYADAMAKGSPSKAYNAVIALQRQFDEDIWNNVGGGDGTGQQSLPIQAFALYKNWDYAQADAWVSRIAEEQGVSRRKVIAELDSHPKLTKIIAKLKADKAKATEPAFDIDADFGGEESAAA